jgi:hypothetical protein
MRPSHPSWRVWSAALVTGSIGFFRDFFSFSAALPTVSTGAAPKTKKTIVGKTVLPSSLSSEVIARLTFSNARRGFFCKAQVFLRRQKKRKTGHFKDGGKKKLFRKAPALF